MVSSDLRRVGLEARAPHLRCSAGEVAPIVLLPGDPGRCDRIGQRLQDAREVAFNREFRTITGSFRGVPVSATSTGIGGPSTAIAAEELIRLGAKVLLRVGSCGGVQPGLAMGTVVIADSASREDGTSRIYAPDGFPAVADPAMVLALQEAANRHAPVSGGSGVITGVVRSHDSFYTDAEEELMTRARALGVLASDMETAPLLVVARLRGVRAASILTVVVTAEGGLEEGIGEFAGGAETAVAGEARCIEVALEACHQMWQESRR